MTKTEVLEKLTALITGLPLPDNHEGWPALYNGALEGITNCLNLQDLLVALAQSAPPRAGAEPEDTELVCQAVMGWVRKSENGLLHGEIRTATGYSSKVISQALRLLVRDGHVWTEGVKRGKRYIATAVQPDG